MAPDVSRRNEGVEGRRAEETQRFRREREDRLRSRGLRERVKRVEKERRRT